MMAAEQIALSDEGRAYLRARGFVRDDVIRSARLTDQRGFIRIPWLGPDGSEQYHKLRSTNGHKKYLNPKGATRPPLFATPLAYDSVCPALVESELDALLCLQAGMPAFATAGTFREDAAELLGRSAREVVIVPDCDEAGERCRERVVGALAGKLPLSEVLIPGGLKDVGDVAQRAGDPVQAVAALLDDAAPVQEESGTVPLPSALGEPEGSEGWSELIVPAPEVASGEDVTLEYWPFLGREGFVVKGFSTLIPAYPKVWARRRSWSPS